MWKRSETLSAHPLTNVQLLNPASSLSVLYFQFNINTVKADKPDIHTGTGGIKHQEPAHEQIPMMRCEFSFLIRITWFKMCCARDFALLDKESCYVSG